MTALKLLEVIRQHAESAAIAAGGETMVSKRTLAERANEDRYFAGKHASWTEMVRLCDTLTSFLAETP